MQMRAMKTKAEQISAHNSHRDSNADASNEDKTEQISARWLLLPIFLILIGFCSVLKLTTLEQRNVDDGEKNSFISFTTMKVRFRKLEANYFVFTCFLSRARDSLSIGWLIGPSGGRSVCR